MVCKEYTGAVCRSKEKFLITDKELDKLAGGSYSEAKKFVIEKGFGKGAEDFDDDENLIREEEKNFFSFIKEYSPNAEFKRLSLIKNDYHNLNALIRKNVFGVDGEIGLLPSGNYSVETLTDAVSGKKADVSPEMKKVVEEAKLLTGGENRGAKLDGIIQKYKYAESLKLAKKVKRVLIALRRYIDGLNVSTAVRSGSEKITEEYFIGGGFIPLDKILALTGENVDKDLLTGETGDLIKSALQAKKDGLPLIEFERTLESYGLAAFMKDKYVLCGYDLFYLYCRYKENEIKNVRMLLAGLKCGLKKSEIIKRFRLNYGG